MKSTICLTLISLIIMLSCTSKEEKQVSDNPFLNEYDTPFGVPPFDKIKDNHFESALSEGMKIHAEEISKISENPDDPTFSNTIEAMEFSGELLTNVSSVFYNLNSANTNDEIQRIAREFAPKMAKHSDDILLNKALFEKVKKVYDQHESLNLSQEQKKLLDDTYKSFIRGGAGLADEKQAELRRFNEEISVLTQKFAQNVLKETNDFQLVIDKKEDLSGLPQSLVDAAAEEANNRDLKGKWVFTLQNPSVMPFLTYSDKRDLREKMLKAYLNRGDQGNENDNKQTVARLANLRAQRAQLLGYENHAAYVLDEAMAKTPAQARQLLKQVWEAALPVAQNEAKHLQKLINKEGKNFKLESWDWRYYTEKLKAEKFQLNEDEIKPYFALDSVRNGIFWVVKNLYGLQFVQRTDLPVYHEDVITYEVKEADGSHLGVLYMDFHPRESKRGGAWMTSYRSQQMKDGKRVNPVISIVCNFSKPAAGKPALLTFDETTTFFHEFGHALHGLLSQTTYRSLAGTSVSRDFVELPSQIMERWAAEPEVMKQYAHHYETGAPIPDDLIKKMNESENFNIGFATTEYLAASFLDMEYHMLQNDSIKDVASFENETIAKMGLMPEIPLRYRSTYFSHIFAGGYSAGYYSYIWSEVLDADAFELFKEKGIFDNETAQSFRKNILEKGDTEDPMVLYKRFRGSEPTVDALLESRGLTKKEDLSRLKL